ncbi:glycoside hydrolase N-terminal domain-containing protein [Streptomyces sp. NBC_00250]|uniref:glycoside hydrolase N-terminal domain-containing protein n=1 Tax=Streptomyces sp. NBC_00250 TaxID=2903641 RepID=UPI003FA7E8CC
MIHGTWEPAPATRWEDAFLAGNGRHGALVLGDPEDDRVIVTHHTLVRPNNAPADTLVEALVQSTPARLVLLPAPPARCPRGRLTGVRTRFGARVDLTWLPGTYRAVLRPDRDAEIDLRTPAGAARLVLRAGEERTVGS